MSRSSGTLNDDTIFALSTRSLRDELRRREEELGRPECGSGNERGSYNLSLHVFALFLILALSTIACSFPIIARRFPKLPIPHRFLFLSRHFGTGVLIATAFVHLLPTAFVSLTDPCLPPFWTQGYPASAGLIAMLAVLTVVGIEMFFATKGAAHSHGTEYGVIDQDTAAAEEALAPVYTKKSFASKPGPKHLRQESLKFFDSPAGGSVEQFSGHANGYQHAQMNMDSNEGYENGKQESFEDLTRPRRQRRSLSSNNSDSDSEHDSEHDVPEPDPLHTTQHKAHNDPDTESRTRSSTAQTAHEAQKLLLQCLLLEAGILFHSIFIGMALSVATGTPFIVLLVAISFHQTFEGLALGSRIAAIPSFGPSSPKPWLMALAYGTTTPVGQAIGLVIRNLYDPESETGLLMVGVMNAVSSGLLLFAGLVELLAEDFLSDKSYEALQGRKRLQACGAVVAGSLLMALVGAWA